MPYLTAVKRGQVGVSGNIICVQLFTGIYGMYQSLPFVISSDPLVQH